MKKRVAKISEGRKNFDKTLGFLKTKKRILFLTTSNRWSGEHELPKSTRLAHLIKSRLGKKVKIINVPEMTSSHTLKCGVSVM